MKSFILGIRPENYTFHLWTVQEDGTVQELLPEGVFKIQEGRSYGVIPILLGNWARRRFWFQKARRRMSICLTKKSVATGPGFYWTGCQDSGLPDRR